MIRSLLLAACAALLSLPAGASIVDVTQTGFGFSPANVTIQEGDTVRWLWTNFNHDVTEGTDGSINGNEAFTSPLNAANPVFSFTFDAAFVAANPRPGGVYDYFCSIHFAANMKGTVTVLPGSTGTIACPGDGSGTACPCANNSAVGAGDGCLSSLGTAARLRGTGAASVAGDTLALQGTAMPNSSALYFQGTALQNGGAGSVFGDGLRCAGGSIIRLGTKTNAGGASSYPVAGDVSISVKGVVAAGNTRHYQIWYRNAAAFCTASTFNLSNALSITWGA